VATTQAATVASQQEFDPWGKVRSGGISQTTINFTGQRLDGTGLLYYHARMYDPLLGRFVSADNIIPNPANPQNLNRYTYVGNNPVNHTDPTGHQCGESPTGGDEEENAEASPCGAAAKGIEESVADENGGQLPECYRCEEPGADTVGSRTQCYLAGDCGQISPARHAEKLQDTPADEVVAGPPLGKASGRYGEEIGPARGYNEPDVVGRHNAEIEISDTETGEVKSRWKEVSGEQTPEQKALGQRKGELSSHTEAKGTSRYDLQADETMTIKGTRPPCSSCKGYMNRAAQANGGRVVYQWQGNEWVANNGKPR
jgi:RHS repeat-associated protein